MSSWILIAAGKSLMAAFDVLAPGRDHTSDGTIGDTAHVAEGNSDHLPDEDYAALRNLDADHINEVHAIDVDNDLRESDLTMEKVVQFLLGRCRSGAEKRLRYIIYNRRIWSASSGWVQKAYTGASAHTEHAHFSFSYVTSLEASTASWHLEDIPVALTAADKTWIVEAIKANAGAGPIGSKTYPTRTGDQAGNDLAEVRAVLVFEPGATKDGATIAAGAPIRRIIAAADKILAE
jgi:hypothetical protein